MNYQELIEFLQKVWKNYRWELFVVLSILIIIFAYFFAKEDYHVPNPVVLHKRKRKVVAKKHERRCREIVQELFGVPFETVRPNFLKNPITKKNLELDMYNQDLQLAFEYQGKQHREFTKFFQKTKEDFYSQVERDKFKANRCKELGIDLICIPDTVHYDNLQTYIIAEIQKIDRFQLN